MICPGVLIQQLPMVSDGDVKEKLLEPNVFIHTRSSHPLAVLFPL
jgi:hypothetical protein